MVLLCLGCLGTNVPTHRQTVAQLRGTLDVPAATHLPLRARHMGTTETHLWLLSTLLLSQTGWQTRLCSSPWNVYCSECCLAGFCFTLSTCLVTFPSLLVVSLGVLLHNRLLERMEGHMEDTHCSESARKTQTTRKISMFGHRVCCRMRPPADVISPFVLPLVLPLDLPVLHVLLHPGIAALPLPVPRGLTPLIVLCAVLPHSPQRKNKLHLEGAPGWLTRSPGTSVRPQGWDYYSPAYSCPPTNPCCCISLDQFPKEGRLVEM